MCSNSVRARGTLRTSAITRRCRSISTPTDMIANWDRSASGMRRRHKPAGAMPTTERASPRLAASSAIRPPMELPAMSTGSLIPSRASSSGELVDQPCHGELGIRRDRRLAESGNVEGDDAPVLGELVEHRQPGHGRRAAAVQQHQRSPDAAFDAMPAAIVASPGAACRSEGVAGFGFLLLGVEVRRSPSRTSRRSGGV